MAHDNKRRLTPEQQALATANLKLVYRLAHRYARARVLTFDELASEGCLALVRYVVPGYKPESGYAFSTYAIPSLARYMKRALRKAEQRIRRDKTHDDRPEQSMAEFPAPEDDAGPSHGLDPLDVLWSLDDVRRSVLSLRLGLVDGPPRSWEEVAAVMGRTVAEVQILYGEAIYQARAEAVWYTREAA